MHFAEQKYEDPVLTPEQVRQIGSRVVLDCYSNEHRTLEDGEAAATYCHNADLIVPEVVGWDTVQVIGANLLTGYFSESTMGDLSEQLSDDFVAGLEQEPPYIQGFFNRLRLSHSRIECVDVGADDAITAKVKELATHDWGWTKAIIRLDGLDFDGRLAQFSKDMQPAIDATREREAIKRRNLAALLLEVSYDPSFAPGRKGRIVHIEGELHRTPQWLKSIGLDITQTVTSKSYPNSYFRAITLAMESRSLSELDLAKAMMHRHITRAALRTVHDAVQVQGADPGRFDVHELAQRYAELFTLDDLRRIGNASDQGEVQALTDSVIARAKT